MADPFEEIDAVYQAIGRDLFGRDDLQHALSARDDPDEAAFFTLVLVGSEIDNGGFAQLFTNSTGDVFTDAIAGADRFGYRTTFACFATQAASSFPTASRPTSRRGLRSGRRSHSDRPSTSGWSNSTSGGMR